MYMYTGSRVFIYTQIIWKNKQMVKCAIWEKSGEFNKAICDLNVLHTFLILCI